MVNFLILYEMKSSRNQDSKDVYRGFKIRHKIDPIRTYSAGFGLKPNKNRIVSVQSTNLEHLNQSEGLIVMSNKHLNGLNFGNKY